MKKYYYSGSNISKGSRGKDVTEWQKFLSDEGYYTGAIDGDFGDLTDKATRDYQTDKGLSVDGLVGSQTWGDAGFINYNDLGEAPDYSDYYMGSYLDTAEGKADKKAMDDALANLNAYGKFDYDINKDALYQQAVERYQQMGKTAMEDTMGQAAAMTGGYGNSYASVAGNQAYQSYMQSANDDLDKYYQMALNKYTAEHDRLADIYNRAVYDLESGESMHRNAQYVKNTAYNAAVDEYNADTTEKTNAKKSTEALTTDDIKMLQGVIGVTQDGDWGNLSKSKSGGLTAEEAYDAWKNGDLKPVEEAAPLTDYEKVEWNAQDQAEYENNNLMMGNEKYYYYQTNDEVYSMLANNKASVDDIVNMLIELVQNKLLSRTDVESVLYWDDNWKSEGNATPTTYENILNAFNYRISKK